MVLGGVDAGLWGHGIGQRSRCAAMGSACVRARDAAEAHTLMDQKTGIVLLSQSWKLRQVWEFSDHMKYLYNATFVHLLLYICLKEGVTFVHMCIVPRPWLVSFPRSF